MSVTGPHVGSQVCSDTPTVTTIYNITYSLKFTVPTWTVSNVTTVVANVTTVSGLGFDWTAGCSQLNVSSLVGPFQSDGGPWQGTCYNFTQGPGTNTLIIPAGAFWFPAGIQLPMLPNNNSRLNATQLLTATNFSQVAFGTPATTGVCWITFASTLNFAMYQMNCSDGATFVGTLFLGLNPVKAAVNSTFGPAVPNFYIQQVLQNTSRSGSSVPWSYPVISSAASSSVSPLALGAGPRVVLGTGYPSYSTLPVLMTNFVSGCTNISGCPIGCNLCI